MFGEKTERNAATLSPQDNRTRKQPLIKTEMKRVYEKESHFYTKTSSGELYPKWK